ncbi:MAG: hypothetical protein ACI9U2_004591 [Bradymonadia bacterium]|jgi:hypothetical protein
MRRAAQYQSKQRRSTQHRSTQRGAVIGLMLFGLLFFAAGLAVILFLPMRGELRCGGDPPMCVLERGGLATPEIRQFAASDIAGARIDEREDDEGTMLYRPVIMLKSGAREPLQGGFSNLGDPQGDTAKIEAWLAAPSVPLTLSSGSAWFALIFGGVFALAGFGVMLLGWVKDSD